MLKVPTQEEVLREIRKKFLLALNYGVQSEKAAQMFGYYKLEIVRSVCQHSNPVDTGMKWSYCKDCNTQMVFDAEKGYIEDPRAAAKKAEYELANRLKNPCLEISL